MASSVWFFLLSHSTQCSLRAHTVLLEAKAFCSDVKWKWQLSEKRNYWEINSK